MGQYTICNDYLELIAGTSNTITQAYKEAADNAEKNNKMGLSYIKNFITSIENIANKDGVKDKRISETRGNLKKFTGYDNIKFAIEFIQKNLAGAPGLRDMIAIHDKLIEFQPKYSDAYDKNVRLAILEYESGVYLLTTGLSMLLANNMEVIQNGVNLKIQKTNESTHGIIDKTIKDFSAQITNKDHGVYLDELIKATENSPATAAIGESTFMEDTVADTVNIVNSIIGSVRKLVGLGVNAVKTVKRSIFGIVPLIRSTMYLKYKKKADTINSLDEQCAFIHRNIDQLQNMKNIDPDKKAEIIKKQQATIERYQKKAAKLRAQLMEAEKEASTAIEKENPELKKSDDDFVLEGVSISKIFNEANDASEGSDQSTVCSVEAADDILALAKKISSNDKTIISEITKCIKDPEKWFNELSDDKLADKLDAYYKYNKNNTRFDQSKFVYQLMIELLNESNYISANMHHRMPCDEFINDIKNINNFKKFKLTIDGSWFSDVKDNLIKSFVNVIYKKWANATIVDIDLTQESYSLAIVKSEDADEIVAIIKRIDKKCK